MINVILKYVKFCSQSSGDHAEEEKEKLLEPGRMEDIRRTRLSASTNPAQTSSQRLKNQAQGPQGSAQGPLCKYYSHWLCIFMGLLTARISGSLTLTPALGTLSPVGLPCQL